MKIAIDITPLQNLHSVRGIGSVVRNLLSDLEYYEPEKYEYLFLALDDDISNTEKIVSDLVNKNKVKYSINFVFPYTAPIHKNQSELKTLAIKLSPGIAKRMGRLILQLIAITRKTLDFVKLRVGLSTRKIIHSPDLAPDIYLQLDPTILLPKFSPITKSIIMVHDLIPYVLEHDYLLKYKTARKNNIDRRSSLRRHLDRLIYINTIRQNCKNCVHILSDSSHTKDDLLKYTKTNPNKITPVLLGVRTIINNLPETKPMLVVKHLSPWGYIEKQIALPNKPFLFFAGGADNRRKLKEIFAAFNNLKAKNYDIALVLAGDTMANISELPNDEAREYLKSHSTYLNDIYFVGYVSEETLHWLYTNALVFVYPSVYEGFGLPILEAMQYGTPVITYKNSSIPEVAGDAAMYANDFLSIENHVINLLTDPSLSKKYSVLSKKQAGKFSWQQTTKQILSILTSS